MSALIGFWNELANVADGVKYLGWYLGPWPVPPTLIRDNQSINDVLTSTPEKISVTQHVALRELLLLNPFSFLVEHQEFLYYLLLLLLQSTVFLDLIILMPLPIHLMA